MSKLYIFSIFFLLFIFIFTSYFLPPTQAEVFKAILTGVLVFIINQNVFEFIIKPQREYKTTIIKINHQLEFYDQVIHSEISNELINQKQEKNSNLNLVAQNSINRAIQAENVLRDLSCELKVTYNNLLICKPDQDKINEASKILMYLSNTVFTKNKDLDVIDKKIERVKELLRLIK